MTSRGVSSIATDPDYIHVPDEPDPRKIKPFPWDTIEVDPLPEDEAEEEDGRACP